MTRRKTVRRTLVAALAAALALSILPAVFAGGGGHILPPGARPHGYTLADLAQAVAQFTSSGNDPDFYPDTPFQILSADPGSFDFEFVGDELVISGSNTITVPAGTPFYLPLFNADDSPPVVGTYPTTAADAVGYVFDPEQLGLEDVVVVVDGQPTRVGPAYVAGPVQTPPLLDGGGTHMITVGVFLTPLTPGTHTVSFTGRYAGDLIQGLGLSALASDFSYTVNVAPGR